MQRAEYQPGDPVPNTGLYEELNVFGTPTGTIVLVNEHDPLPEAARGFTWRPLSERSATELRSLAHRYREMARHARTRKTMQSLSTIADRLETLAQRKEAKGPA